MEVDGVYKDFHKALKNPIKTLFLTCLYAFVYIYLFVFVYIYHIFCL